MPFNGELIDRLPAPGEGGDRFVDLAAARPTFQTAGPICWPVQVAMCAHSVSVRPIASRVMASGAVSWCRQIRTSQEAIRMVAIVTSSEPGRADGFEVGQPVGGQDLDGALSAG